MSQLDLLRRHFEQKETITPVEADILYRIRSLPKRICDLKAKGYEFNIELRKDLTGRRYAVYTIVSFPDEDV